MAGAIGAAPRRPFSTGCAATARHGNGQWVARRRRDWAGKTCSPAAVIEVADLPRRHYFPLCQSFLVEAASPGHANLFCLKQTRLGMTTRRDTTQGESIQKWTHQSPKGKHSTQPRRHRPTVRCRVFAMPAHTVDKARRRRGPDRPSHRTTQPRRRSSPVLSSTTIPLERCHIRIGDRFRLMGEPVPVFGDPGEAATALGQFYPPPTKGFQSVVSPTCWTDSELIRRALRERRHVIKIAKVSRSHTSWASACWVQGFDVVTQSGRRPVLTPPHIHRMPSQRISQNPLPHRILLRSQLQCPLRRQPPVPGEIPRLRIHPQHRRRRQGETDNHLRVLEPLARQKVHHHISGDLIHSAVVASGLDLPCLSLDPLIRQLCSFHITLHRQHTNTVIKTLMHDLPSQRLRRSTPRGSFRVRACHRST